MGIKITRESQSSRPGQRVISMKAEPFNGLFTVSYLVAQEGPDKRLYWRAFLAAARGLTEAQAKRLISEEVGKYGEEWGIRYLAGAEHTGLCP